ncbi:hypothetical protein R4Z10_08385 [Niallia sp. XMNu-256]|uniref:hypothetical protein n=1 Tax=Niallia sp. XMNu-256 TaxID=3082444 RepID=UPI0030D625C0
MDYTDSQEEKIASIIIRMRETEILRGEVLLYDLFSNEEFDITVEEIIIIVFLDFFQQIKSDGSSLKVQKSILSHIKRCS